MRYLITIQDDDPFFSDHFSSENHFNSEIGMIVYDLQNGIWTNDGILWFEIEENHL